MWEYLPQDILTLNILGGSDSMCTHADGDVTRRVGPTGSAAGVGENDEQIGGTASPGLLDELAFAFTWILAYAASSARSPQNRQTGHSYGSREGPSHASAIHELPLRVANR